MYTKTISQPIALAVTILAVCSLWWTSTALANCGDIITVYDYGDGQGAIDEREPIIDCTNPFNADTPAPFAYELTLAGQAIVENTVVSVIESEPVSGFYSLFDRSNNFSYAPFQLFQQEGEDFRQVAVINNQNFTLEPLPAGEYTAVLLYEEPPIIMVEAEPLWKQWFQSWFMPATAHAFFEDYAEVVAISFTIEYEAPTPTGASSVLFLPGIQASRLYIEEDGAENQLWEPNRNADVEKLAMTEEGVSVNSVYTKDVIDEVNVLPLGQSNIYKSFLNFLEDLKSEDVIKNYKPFAYDWRYSVQDVVFSGTRYKDSIKGLVDEVESLASSSFTKKVTVVAHSNGGLLAKSLITELDRLEEANLIDKVIFIGTPHLGTPKALGTILHGYDQQKLGGAVVDDKTAREVINNMPGAYGLLPSEEYLAKSTEPIISFREGLSTNSLTETFGDSVSGVSEYTSFLNGGDGRTNDYDNIGSPYNANAAVLDDALRLHRDVLDDWFAPEGIEVYDIVGVGLKTIKAVEYRDVTEHVTCRVDIFGNFTCDDPVHFIRPYAHFTQYGDETVTALSAESVVGERYYFDFDGYNRSLLNPLLSYQHADFTETKGAQTFVANILMSTSTQIAYISSEKPKLSREYEILSIDSPVRVVVEDFEGNKTGVERVGGELVVRQEIPSSQYLEFAGTKYLITPKDIDVKTTLYGENYGGYTLTISTLTSEDVQLIDSEMVNATTTPDMVASFSRTEDGYSTVTTDLDGDGQVDVETKLNGELVNRDAEVSFSSLRDQISALGLPRRKSGRLLLLVNVAERLLVKAEARHKFAKPADKILRVISRTVSLYGKKGWIEDEDEQDLQSTIEVLRANLK